MTPIRAVIFDMDGVLIDSEPVYLRHQYAQLRLRYPWITLESMYPVVGMAGQDYPPFMARLCRRQDDAAFRRELDALNAGCQVYYPDILRPQVRPVLQALRRMGLQLALASSSSRENIDLVLSQCDIGTFFDCIVSGYDFRRSKPDPEIYRHTMDLLGREPAECLIVEDSTYGIQAGTAAGGVVAALQDDRFPFDQSAAPLHIRSLEELPALAACGGRQIRAVFLDVDGTLITVGDHRLPPSARTALAQLHRRGIPVILSTGRHRLEIQEESLLPGLDFDGAVYMNGQLCEWQGRTVWQNPLAPADLRALRLFLEESGRSCIFLEQDCMYANRVDDRMVTEQRRIGTAIPPVRSLEGLETRRIFQAMPFISPAEEGVLLQRVPGCRATRWGAHVIDLMNRSGGKETGIQKMCQALGITPRQTIAFGDAENDLGMLRLAGIGVAMGNALPAVRASADLVTDPVEEDGLYNALHALQLI